MLTPNKYPKSFIFFNLVYLPSGTFEFLKKNFRENLEVEDKNDCQTLLMPDTGDAYKLFFGARDKNDDNF